MTETAKKATTPKKPRTTATKATAAPKAAASKTKAVKAKVMVMPSHEEIAALAHRFWTETGQQHGHHEEHWLRAEQELFGKAS